VRNTARTLYWREGYNKYVFGKVKPKGAPMYEDIGGRCFRPPDGGPIRMLTKKSRFGASLRLGKLGERWMPKSRGRSGVVIST